jgi:putative salt-induced outer membrane protein YdiY
MNMMNWQDQKNIDQSTSLSKVKVAINYYRYRSYRPSTLYFPEVIFLMYLIVLLATFSTPVSSAVITNFLDEEADESQWHGFADIGGDFAFGDDKSRDINVNAEAEKVTADTRWELELEYFLAESKSSDEANYTTTQDEYEVSSKYDIYIAENTYLWLSQGLYADEVDGVELGVELGVGIGHQIFSRGRLRKTQYEVEFGAIYIRADNQFKAGEPDSDVTVSGVGIGHEFVYKFRRGIVFLHEMVLLEITSSPKNTLIDMENALAVSLNEDMFLRLSLESEWDEKASKTAGEESTEHQLFFKLGWKF